MNKVCSFLLVMVMMLSGCSLFEKKDEGIEGDEVVVTQQPNVEVMAQKLQVPWSIDKVNQAFYISERTGSIVKIENGKTERQLVHLTQPLAKAAEAGLLGFVLDPQFLENKKAYAYYTYSGDGKGQFNRVVVLRTNGSV